MPLPTKHHRHAHPHPPSCRENTPRTSKTLLRHPIMLCASPTAAAAGPMLRGPFSARLLPLLPGSAFRSRLGKLRWTAVETPPNRESSQSINQHHRLHIATGLLLSRNISFSSSPSSPSSPPSPAYPAPLPAVTTSLARPAAAATSFLLRPLLPLACVASSQQLTLAPPILRYPTSLALPLPRRALADYPASRSPNLSAHAGEH